MDDKRRKELVDELKRAGVGVQLAEDGVVVECYIHDEALDVFVGAIRMTARFCNT